MIRMAVSTPESKLMVAAIDFGTTFSGYAFAMRDDLDRDPPKIFAPHWNAPDGGLISFKTPTTVLLNKEEKLEEFGFDAESRYAELAEEGEHEDYFYFRRFKMMLYDKVRKGKLTIDAKVQDIRGRELPAVKVFSHAIKFLKNHLEDSLKSRGSIVKKEDIDWVLTVPAIWDDPAKFFMRKAAQEAGIPAHQLTIALEPEAASIYCKHLPVEKLEGANKISVFRPGNKYLVLDAGGGTVDITVHEVKGNGNLKELDRASGGDWGGVSVDMAFKDALMEIVTKGMMEGYCHKFTADYIAMFRDFEIKKRKRNAGDAPDSKINLKIPATFIEECSETLEEDFTTLTNKSRFRNHLYWGADKVRIDLPTFDSFFQPACDGIIKHVRELFQSPKVRGVKKILMVGGFSESFILQEAVRKAFPECQVIVPQEAGLAVLRGAVLFGDNPKLIDSRIAKYTYGVDMSVEFNATEHKESKKHFADDVAYCTDVFDRHVQKGDELIVDEAQAERSYVPLTSYQKKVSFGIYTSTEDNPFYTDYCENIGRFVVEVPLGIDDRSINARMIFGGTEVKVEAKVVHTGEITPAEFELPEDEKI
ncbi:heat shock 70 kDa protein 12B-like isoform X2 [Ostrea edulis]|uniref:heat shock 70 kDa protein 12B-like isoform X2 n=2 Tax=Ostrea edulis TaxID=37623 RepID=UPI0024AEEAEA|nr:heat shock 70 kDa protein 12B-like isoform X2 [Ostrea edulis]